MDEEKLKAFKEFIRNTNEALKKLSNEARASSLKSIFFKDMFEELYKMCDPVIESLSEMQNDFDDTTNDYLYLKIDQL